MIDVFIGELDSAALNGEPATAERSPGSIPCGKTIPLPRPEGQGKDKRPAYRSDKNGQRREKLRTNDEVVGDGTAGSVGKVSRETRREQIGATRPTGVRAFVVATKRGNARGAKGRREMEA
jgi:hypothetical protein